MPMRDRLVVEVRLECNGHLVVAYLPVIPGELTEERLKEPIHWFIEIDQGKGFAGPLYRVFRTGEDEKARDDIRRFLRNDPRAARTAGASR
jgi:hypothetical protein